MWARNPLHPWHSTSVDRHGAGVWCRGVQRYMDMCMRQQRGEDAYERERDGGGGGEGERGDGDEYEYEEGECSADEDTDSWQFDDWKTENGGHPGHVLSLDGAPAAVRLRAPLSACASVNGLVPL